MLFESVEQLTAPELVAFVWVIRYSALGVASLVGPFLDKLASLVSAFENKVLDLRFSVTFDKIYCN